MAEIIIKSKKYGTHVVLVDDEDFERLNNFRWHIKNKKNVFYVNRNILIKKEGTTQYKQKTIPMHRQIMSLTFGDKLLVDHINHNPLDNRKCNLRIATRLENNRNSTSRKNSSSKYLGVSWSNHNKRWMAYIRIKGKTIHLGGFKIEEDAALAYNQAAVEYFREYANLNKI
jgi:hypothetical protein